MISHKNILIIAGSGRNIGKTSLGERLIKRISKMQAVVSIKVSSHFHKHYDSLRMLVQEPNIIIGEEFSTVPGKDSSRYKMAGARSYYVECEDDALPVLLNWINNSIDNECPVICESGGLGNLIVPGMAIFLEGGDKACMWRFNYHSLNIESPHWEKEISSIRWKNNQWQKVQLHE